MHRDLNANIKVRPDGIVKVLDFGLAKALEPASALSKAAVDSPTITSPAMMTRTGVILGTAAYMSPEQAKGRTIDTRSDVWKDGTELYYLDLDGKLMAASVSTRPAFQAGVPRLLFQTRSGSADAHWAPSPDGRRFLFLVPETQGAAPFTVVLNWPAVLKK